jgi:hypothetical protein
MMTWHVFSYYNTKGVTDRSAVTRVAQTELGQTNGGPPPAMRHRAW